MVCVFSINIDDIV